MSLTLRDAQHLCWKTFRMINDKIAPDKGKEWTPLVTVADLIEDSGKIASLIKASEETESSDKEGEKEELATVLSNVLYTVFVLAENHGVNIEEAFLHVMNDRVISMIS